MNMSKGGEHVGGIKQDNKGMTLVELLISIAISSIVIASIAFFMNYASRNYRNASNDVMLQTEGQTILNQLNEMIIEANNVKFAGATLTIYQEEETITITLDPAANELIYNKYKLDGTHLVTDELAGKYVESWSVVDTGTDDSNRQIGLSLHLRKDSNTYQIENEIVSLRNSIKPVP